MPRLEGIACRLCHDTMMASTKAEAVADAINVGWDTRQGQWICDSCILEEEQL